jgi:hypothetical protein
MKRHEDPFFNHYKDAFANHEVQAPAGTLAAVHRKMKKGGFWYFSWTSLNVYTVVALLSAGLALTLIPQGGESAGKSYAKKNNDLSLVALEKTQITLSQTNLIDESNTDVALLDEQATATPNTTVRPSKATTSGSRTARETRALMANVQRLKARHERILDKDLKHDYEAKFLEEAEAQAQHEAAEAADPVDNVLSAEDILKQAKSGAQETGIILKSKTKTK